MGKTKRDISSTTSEAFHKHYRAIWGERWDASLYPALAEPTRHTALVNRFASNAELFNAHLNGALAEGDLQQIVFPTCTLDTEQKLFCLTQKTVRHFTDPGTPSESACDSLAMQQNHMTSSDGTATAKHAPLPPPTRSHGADGALMTHWNLDAASALAVNLLDVQPGDNILDLCAAPGGKSIAMAQMLWPYLYTVASTSMNANSNGEQKHGSLCINEQDPARFKRLNENLHSYLPSTLFVSKQVTGTKIDGSDAMAYRKLSAGSQGYDKVLVDAPCSSERHIIHESNGSMNAWRSGSSKRLAQLQTELLMTGLRAVKLGGRVMYATCSIEMAENDGVVEKVLGIVEKEVRKGGKWSVQVGFSGGTGDDRLEKELERDWGERTKYGWIVLPDHPSGGRWGPLFFTILTKTKVL